MNTKTLRFMLCILLCGLFCVASLSGEAAGQKPLKNDGQKPPDILLPLLKERIPVSKQKEIKLIPNDFAGIFIIKFVEGSHIRYKDGKFTTSKDQLNGGEVKRLGRLKLSMEGILEEIATVNELTGYYGDKYGFVVLSTFANKDSKQDPEAQFNEKEKLELASGQELADLDLYFTIAAKDFKDMEAQQKFMNSLNELAIIEDVHAAVLAENASAKTSARPEPFNSLSPLPPTPDLSPMQGYLNAAPGGIDARYAWTKPGGRGEGVKLIDVEFNWLTLHEDFAPVTNFFWRNPTVCAPIPVTDHGTAVMGVINAPHNGFGVSGISPNIHYGLANVCQGAAIPGFLFSLFSGENILGRTHNIVVAVTIFQAIPALKPGDILQIEQQTYGPQGEWVPMEYYQETFDAIRLANALGIVVVEAAGNGGNDLDDPRYGRRLDPTNRHSGALLVGASNGNGDNNRAGFSNSGARVDVQGWGDYVVTLGYGGNIYGGSRVPPWSNDISPTRYYTPNFGGTSSASPIVAGAVASIQGVRMARGLPPLNAAGLRTLFIQTGTPQGSASSARHIGPLPNLRTAIDSFPGGGISPGGGTGPGGPSSGGFTGPGTYFIQARHSGKFLEVFGGAAGGLAPLAPIVQFDNNNSETQKFIIESRTGGFFSIKSKYSNQCLDVFGFSPVPVHLEQWPCNGGDNQLFTIEPAGNLYKIRVKHSGLYFGILGGSFINATPLMQMPFTGGDNQLFQFVPTR